jgi:hypothetical protein
VRYKVSKIIKLELSELSLANPCQPSFLPAVFVAGLSAVFVTGLSAYMD